MRRHSCWKGFLVALLTAAAAGCGGGTIPEPDAADTTLPDLLVPDAGDDEGGTPDVPEVIQLDYGPLDPGPRDEMDGGTDAADTATDGLPDGSADAEGPVDPGPADGSDADAPEAVDAPPEATDPGVDTFDDRFGKPCEVPEDCPSRWCLQTDDGKVCSRECLDGPCPDGWDCRPVIGHDGSPTFLCVPGSLDLCRPCVADFDCRAGEFPMPGLRCTSLGNPEGFFCLPGCAGQGDCPAGTSCRTPLDGSATACLPDAGTCTCSPFAVESGAETACTRLASAGTCTGRRTCGPEGLSSCDALSPAAESCNGNDDDCDGLVDEEGAVGCQPRYRDVDRDGVGVGDDFKCLCAGSGLYTATEAGDCDDRNPSTSPRAPEACNGRDDDCDLSVDEEGAQGCAWRYPNVDGDGFGGDAGARCLCTATVDLPATLGGDCDDTDPLAWPGAQEACNGKDDDCDGGTDEEGAVGCQTLYRDDDGDGFGQANLFRCLCAPEAPFTATRVGDCNDGDGAVWPGAPEACNAKDDDCDQVVDQEGASGCAPWFRDVDGDLFGLDGTERCLCRAADLWRTLTGGDCNDGDGAVHPFAAEACNGRDDDCNGVVDDAGATNCVPWYTDPDADGYGDPASAACLCGAEGTRVTDRGGDCDEADPFVNPGALDVCGNGLDEDCSGTPDQVGCSGCRVFYRDVDRDGYGPAANSQCLAAPDEAGFYTAPASGDCDDAEPSIHPGAGESCDGIDQDCDGQTDEEGAAGCTVYFLDNDLDGFGVTGESRCLCAKSGRYTATSGGDCDDADRAVYPGRTESCNQKDDNCNGILDDDGAVPCVAWFLDGDGDGYGATASGRCLCGATGQWTTTQGGDCDDADVTIRPGTSEKCNARDDDCDGQTDEVGAVGCLPWYMDGDGDGFGVAGQSRCLCGADGAWRAPFAGDCADDDPTRYPGAAEVCGGLDEDCDGLTDEDLGVGCIYYFRDVDDDGWGTGLDPRCLCTPEDVYRATRTGDCMDSDPGTNPGAAEACGGMDEDCDGLTDEEGATSCTNYSRDRDNDGFGTPGTERCLCAPLGELKAPQGGDCNDADVAVHPGAVESCNGRDDDCNGELDEPGAGGCLNYYRDQDRDGFGVITSLACLCVPVNPFDARIPGDCDDEAAAVFPDALEHCDGVDEDCDGETDEGAPGGCEVYYRDFDGDGYGDPLDSRCLCAATADYANLDPRDCDDFDRFRNPGQEEVCDGKDNDCDSAVDEAGTPGCVDRYKDEDRDGFGAAAVAPECRCTGQAPWDATKAGDCNDAQPLAYPGATETCDAIDNNCDGATDPESTEGCTIYYKDADADGFGVAGDKKCLCKADGTYKVTVTGDCNDSLKTVNPAALESCNARDDDCDGNVDEQDATGCKAWFRDDDRDGFGHPTDSRCLCAAVEPYTARQNNDCCESDKRAHPGQTAWYTSRNNCNSWDYDCDGTGNIELNLSGGCTGWGIGSGCDVREGWEGGAPGCGERGKLVTGGCGHCCFLWTCCCSPSGIDRAQGCH